MVRAVTVVRTVTVLTGRGSGGSGGGVLANPAWEVMRSFILSQEPKMAMVMARSVRWRWRLEQCDGDGDNRVSGWRSWALSGSLRTSHTGGCCIRDSFEFMLYK